GRSRRSARSWSPRARRLARGSTATPSGLKNVWSPLGDGNRAPGESASPGDSPHASKAPLAPPLPAPSARLPSQHAPPLRLPRPDLAGVPAMRSLLSASLLSLLLPAAALAQSPGNRLAYLDECNPYYPSRTFPKLITPQWVGEEGV